MKQSSLVGLLKETIDKKEAIIKEYEYYQDPNIDVKKEILATLNKDIYKILNITIPEDLDYTGVFDDIFTEYTMEHHLSRIKTTNMGSMFRLTYQVTLKDAAREKEMIDRLRCRNGNLEITVSRQETTVSEL